MFVPLKYDGGYYGVFFGARVRPMRGLKNKNVNRNPRWFPHPFIENGRLRECVNTDFVWEFKR